MSDQVLTPTRDEKLRTAKDAREQEVENYQINIDNYTRAIQKIDAMPDADRVSLKAFREQLTELLESEVREQSKSQIMLDVLRDQLPD